MAKKYYAYFIPLPSEYHENLSRDFQKSVQFSPAADPVPHGKARGFILDAGERGVVESWAECEKKISGVHGARFRAFIKKQDAEEWLRGGAVYEERAKKLRDHGLLEKGIYFDAGTGRGLGFVEANVTDERGESMLSAILKPKEITKFGTYIIADRDATNNFGELTAMKFALKIAAKKNIKKIFGDSKLVIEYWSKGIAKKSGLKDEAYKLIEQVKKARRKFEDGGGEASHISGDRNPADLGFHK